MENGVDAEDTASTTTWESHTNSSVGSTNVEVDANSWDDMYSEIFKEIDEYVQSHWLDYASPLFHDNLKNEITEDMYDAVVLSGTRIEHKYLHQDMVHMVESIAQNYFHHAGISPPRSYPPDTDAGELTHAPPSAIQSHIAYLKSLVQPDQRTPEWYAFRHDLLTASNIYNALGSIAQRNKLICEKCKPLAALTDAAAAAPTAPNTQSPTHWGQKYEQVTTMIYEHLYPGNSVDADFGCIRHPEHAFIGASPDGIVVYGPRLGHMVEIKNTVSRVIEDTPILSHWIQCQVQMETCGLEYCDYIQTSIGEIDREAFYASDSLRGVILYLISKKEGAANYKYLYMPIQTSYKAQGLGSVESWTRTQMIKYQDEYHLFETHYWTLKQVSCVIIPRNREWFRAALPVFQELWNTVLHDREHGYDHRLPKKRGGGEAGAASGGGRRMCKSLYDSITKEDYKEESKEES